MPDCEAAVFTSISLFLLISVTHFCARFFLLKHVINDSLIIIIIIIIIIIYRKLFGFDEWESVKGFICGLVRLDLHHI